MNTALMLFGKPLSFLQLAGGTAALVAFRYLLLAGLAWLLGYRIFRGRWFHRKIIDRFPKSADIRREILYSALTVGIFGLMGAGTLWAASQGWTRMYGSIQERGWVWFWFSIACTILLHDTYFYWTHRWMHWRPVFPIFHRVHHLSTNPSPWAAYAFAPAEAVVEAGIFPLTALLIPIHPIAFALFMLWQMIFNVAGHTGYEFHPRWLMNSPLRFLVNTPTNHVMHHENMRGNYGLYFNFWDRLMGTNHHDYEDRFREVTHKDRFGNAA